MIETRLLQYFLTVTKERSITRAAEVLHISQPTLSKQLIELETSLGCRLLVRSKKGIILTEEGEYLRNRANEIISLMEHTESALHGSDEFISGDVYIGGGESDAIRAIARIAKTLQSEHPQIHYHLHSGNADDINERLNKGLLDFGIFFGAVDLEDYAYLRLPMTDTWGLLMRKDDPLAEKQSICPSDLKNIPLMVSRQSMVKGELSGWYGQGFEELDIAVTYNLLFSASKWVDEGFGYALCFDKLANTSGDLCFRPLEPRLETQIAVAWKKSQPLSKAAAKFLDALQESIRNGTLDREL